MNVAKLNEASSNRQDDLRELTKELFDVHIRYQEKLAEMRATHIEALAKAEASRLDSIRQVDREDVNKTAAQALNAIQTLAQNTSVTAETLRTQVATTAAAAANQLSTITAEINKRLSALELSSSEGKGKQSYVDPQMDRLTKVVEDLAKAQQQGTGKQQGSTATWAAIIGGVGLVGSIWYLGSQLKPTPQIVYSSPPVTSTPGK